MTGKEALVVGGSNGVGLAVALKLAGIGRVTIVDKQEPAVPLPPNVVFRQFDLLSEDYSLFDEFINVDKLVITAGFGRLALFKDYSEDLIKSMMEVNAVAPIRIIRHFYDRILSGGDFFCAVMVSIAGFMSSPFFAVYGASKAALKIFIESVNVELLKAGTSNRVLNVSPGSLKGTSFNGGENDLSQLDVFTDQLIARMMGKEELWIPQYDEVYKEVLERYHTDPVKEGIHSYEYKVASGRVKI